MSSSVSSRQTLRRIHSNLTICSFLTATNSTVSDIRGPGRLIGRALSAGGRRIEPVISRAAELLGYGPNAVIRRLVAVVRHAHCQDSPHGAVELLADSLHAPAIDTGSPPDHPMQMLLQLVCHPCRECRQPIMDGLVITREMRTLLSRLLEYTTHSEPSTRFLAVSYVSVLAVACESLRLWLVGLGGQRAIQLAQTLSYQGLQEGRDYYENLTIFCLESLQDASDLLLAIEPHCLDVEHPSYADTHFFERHQRYHAYMSEPAVQAGLRTLVNNIRVPGLLSTISMARLQAVLKYGMSVSDAGYWSRHHAFLDLVSQVLSLDIIAGWWALCPTICAYQVLLFYVYEGINRWSIASWRSCSDTLKAHIVERFYLPFLVHCSHDLTTDQGSMTSDSTFRPFLSRRDLWVDRIRCNLRDAGTMGRGMVKSAMELLESLEPTLMPKQPSVPWPNAYWATASLSRTRRTRRSLI